MPAVPCHLNLKPNVCAICAVPLVLELTVCAICAVSFVCGPTVCAICVVCAPNVCAACAVCVGNRLGQLSVARLHVSARRAEIPANINCCCYDCCGSLNVDMVVVWAVVGVFFGPTVCATCGGTDSWPTESINNGPHNYHFNIE